MDKFVKFIARFSAAVSTICIAALAITVASQVFFRKVLNQSLTWTDEYGPFMLVWLTLFGAVAALYDKRHLAITALVERLKGTAKHAVVIISNLCILIFVLILFWYGIPMVLQLMNINAVSIPIPKAYIYAVIPFTSICCAIVIIDAVIKEFKLMLRKEE